MYTIKTDIIKTKKNKHQISTINTSVAIMNSEGIHTIFKSDSTTLPHVKRNNFIRKPWNIIRQLKYLIIVESLLGINRLYLLKFDKFVLWFSYIYIPVITIISMYIIQQVKSTSASHWFIKNTMFIEYIFLVISATFVKRKKLLNFFENLSTFDEYLKINKHNNVVNITRPTVCSIVGSLLYNLLEYLLLKFYIHQGDFDTVSFLFIFMTSLAHDMEQIFYFTLLRIIFKRIVIIRAHVCKILSMDDNETNNKIKSNEIELLADKANLNTDTLHKLYDTLYKCSEQLNTIISFPVTYILSTMFTENLICIFNFKRCECFFLRCWL